ncbi:MULTISPECIES: FadR/GntR family transcriptional regulator [Actinomadura]|uniref:DNA-binding transcriptional regulator, FadR family n=1 Tax=Actinomadura madurae TaxID=1993 RepID=A0A1I5NGQ4_9ACTN|nr:FCD domain-containing protein [Actinomadura madurae]SFP20949.1 DNA-binding transcriptional regulator, FadR family [Actinomadura madurae]
MAGDNGDGVKLAEQIAEQIEQRIVDAGWPIGEIIGSEASLIEQFGVSRGVLREAVRLLEHHGTARMRRGPGGGLVVEAPPARAVRRAAALYLRYRRADVQTVVEARRALELSCVRMVAQQARDPQVADRLRRILDAEVEVTKASGSTRFLRSFHLELADLSGNSAIGLFAEILMELQSEFVNEARRQPASEEVVTADAHASHRAHLAIYNALISGDVERATSVMARHLDAISKWTLEYADRQH